MSKGTFDFSSVEAFDIIIRGERTATFKITPSGSEVLDPANVKVKIGLNKTIVKTLTVGNGIANNGNGSFSINIKAEDFNHSTSAQFEIYGYQGLADIEAAIGNIKYIPSLK